MTSLENFKTDVLNSIIRIKKKFLINISIKFEFGIASTPRLKFEGSIIFGTCPILVRKKERKKTLCIQFSGSNTIF